MGIFHKAKVKLTASGYFSLDQNADQDFLKEVLNSKTVCYKAIKNSIAITHFRRWPSIVLLAMEASVKHLNEKQNAEVNEFALRSFYPLDVSVLLATAKSPFTTSISLSFIARTTTSKSVLNAVYNNPNIDESTAIALIENPHSPVEYLQDFVENPKFSTNKVLEAIANSQQCNHRTLMILVQRSDISSAIKCAALRNNNSDNKIIQEALDYGIVDENVLITAAQQYKSPEEPSANGISIYQYSQEVSLISRIINHEKSTEYVLTAALKNSAITEEDLFEIVSSRQANEKVLLEAVQNSKASCRVLLQAINNSKSNDDVISAALFKLFQKSASIDDSHIDLFQSAIDSVISKSPDHIEKIFKLAFETQQFEHIYLPERYIDPESLRIGLGKKKVEVSYETLGHYFLAGALLDNDRITSIYSNLDPDRQYYIKPHVVGIFNTIATMEVSLS